jgi:hypothetical protein
MASLRQTVERQRSSGTLPTAQISLYDLHRKFGPVPARSTRALLAAMSAGVSRKVPWAVILCRFKDEAAKPNVPLEAGVAKFYREAFTPGTGGLVEYWRDASLGVLDITGSVVFGWVNLDITRAQAGGIGRLAFVDHAIDCAQRDKLDPVTGFVSQIAVCLYNWSNDDPARPAGTPDWQNKNDPLIPWYPTWIDGSQDGATGKITLTPPHDGDVTAHEMGHTFGMQHDFSADGRTPYADACCIMSQTPTFPHPAWQVAFGPAVCLPHLVQQGWMYAGRVYEDSGGWMTQRGGVGYPLAQVTDPGARANLGLKLAYRNGTASWDYYVEYVRPNAWNRGLGSDLVIVRRIANTGVGPTPSILGQIVVPAVVGIDATFVEPYGNVSFRAERSDKTGRVVKVGVRKL